MQHGPHPVLRHASIKVTVLRQTAQEATCEQHTQATPTTATAPDEAELCLDVEVPALLPGAVEAEEVAMRGQFLVALHLHQPLPPVPLAAERLPGTLHCIQTSVVTATDFEYLYTHRFGLQREKIKGGGAYLAKRPRPQQLQDLVALFKVRLLGGRIVGGALQTCIT